LNHFFLIFNFFLTNLFEINYKDVGNTGSKVPTLFKPDNNALFINKLLLLLQLLSCSNKDAICLSFSVALFVASTNN